MEINEMIKFISAKTGKREDEIKSIAANKRKQLNNMITEEGSYMLIAQEMGVELKMKEEKDIELEEDVTEVGTSRSEEILELDDLGKKFIKSPKVGESVEFVLKQIKKSKNIDAIDKTGHKFKTNLTSVDYKIVYVTRNDEEFSPKAWEIIGKINAICKKLKKIDGVELQVKHIKDGMKEKDDKDNYDVKVKIDDGWKTLDRKTNNWK